MPAALSVIATSQIGCAPEDEAHEIAVRRELVNLCQACPWAANTRARGAAARPMATPDHDRNAGRGEWP